MLLPCLGQSEASLGLPGICTESRVSRNKPDLRALVRYACRDRCRGPHPDLRQGIRDSIDTVLGSDGTRHVAPMVLSAIVDEEVALARTG